MRDQVFCGFFCKSFLKKQKDYDRLWPFYCMFRAEFLHRYKIFSKLSPDAYSNFQSPLQPEEKSQVTRKSFFFFH